MTNRTSYEDIHYEIFSSPHHSFLCPNILNTILKRLQ